MKAREPAITPPIGAPRPFEKSIQAESQPAAMSRADIFVATQAFNSRAPSMWVIEPVRLGDRDHFIERRLLPDGAAADIGGLLDADDGLRRLVTRARMQRCTKCFGGELPVVARQRRDLESAERRMRAAFAGNDMRADMGQNFIARPAMGERRRDVAHGARRHEHGRFLAEQFSHAFAQQIHRRVVADLLVANLRPRHRLAHRGVGRVCVSDSRLMRMGSALGSRGAGV